MKIRQGFVSNSSSSSFIVAFPKDMEKTDAAVHQYLFGDNFGAITAYDWIGTFGTAEIAAQVAQDLREQEANVADNITEALGGHLPGAPDFDNFRKRRPDGNGYDYDWPAYEKASEEFRAKMAEKIQKEFEGKDVYTFEYSDNDGNFFCTMEHGGIFDNVPHMRVSNH